jgi:hypothetical protein
MQFRGRVIKKPFATGSKSERKAVFLVTDEDEYVLRHEDGNPFFDPVVEALVGKRISCQGVVTGYTLIMSEWTELSDETDTQPE